jgi:hypothetical protein
VPGVGQGNRKLLTNYFKEILFPFKTLYLDSLSPVEGRIGFMGKGKSETENTASGR